jgi:uncharacterized protein YjbJ (UPF0337 family)
MTGYGLIGIRNQSKKISRSNHGILISAEGYGQMKIPKHKKKSNPIGQRFEQVRYQVRGQVRDQVMDQVKGQVREQVGDQVEDQVWAQVWDQVEDQVWAQVWGQVKEQTR